MKIPISFSIHLVLTQIDRERKREHENSLTKFCQCIQKVNENKFKYFIHIQHKHYSCKHFILNQIYAIFVQLFENIFRFT